MAAWVLPAIQAGTALFSALRGGRRRSPMDENPALAQMLQAAVNAQTYGNALANPESKHFRNLAGIFRDDNFRQALRGIAEQERLHQRALARGAARGLFNPERRDESKSKAVAQMLMRAGVVGNQQAVDSLSRAANANAAAAGSLGNAVGAFTHYGDINRQGEIGQMKGIGDFITKILDEFGKKGDEAGGPKNFLPSLVTPSFETMNQGLTNVSRARGY